MTLEEFLAQVARGVGWSNDDVQKLLAIIRVQAEAIEKYCTLKAMVKTLDGVEPIDWELTPAGIAQKRVEEVLNGK